MKFLISILAVFVLAFVGVVNAGDLVAGGGATVSMFNTQGHNSETTPFTLLGYGLETTTDFGGGLIPNESYLIGQYGRVKDLTTDEFTSIYKVNIAGIWYLADSTQKLQPFFLMRAGLENQDSQGGGSISYLNSQFGLGAGYPVSKKASVWGTITFVMGAKISADLATGVKIEIGK